MEMEEHNLAKFEKALDVLGESTVREVRIWLDENFPRKDGRDWDGGMVLLGDFARYPDDSPVSTSDPNAERPFLKTTPKGRKPSKFKLR